MTKISQAVRASGAYDCPPSSDLLRRYCAEVSCDLLDEQGVLLDYLIGLAFDTLEARVLDLRVVPGTDVLL